MPTSSSNPRTVDEYIALFGPQIQTILKKVRSAVTSAAPNATEIISYGMPAFRQDRVLLYFGAFKGHIGFYPPIRGDARLEADASIYAGEKGNLRFPYDKPIHYDLISALTKLRAQQDLALAPTKRRVTGS